MNCPNCGSRDTENVSGDYWTGVVAPDGGREMRYEDVWECLHCGLEFDPDDAEPDRDPDHLNPADDQAQQHEDSYWDDPLRGSTKC